MISENELRRKRALVGLLAIACTIAGGLLLITARHAGTASAFVRVGLLLGAFWLALPTRDRPAAWARVSPWTVGLVVVAGIVLPRAKPMIPFLVAGLLIGWLVRPRKRKGP
ncbi:MAG: hypothetical protein ABGZ35_12440 [Planctomycetaceae bacterium]|jgi:hypothetical protein